MKKKVSALIVAVGMAALPLSAKQTKITHSEAKENLEKRHASTGKRLHRKKAEKELLKEIDQEIEAALTSKKTGESEVIAEKVENKSSQPKIFLKDKMPNRGLDISDQFRELKEGNSSG